MSRFLSFLPSKPVFVATHEAVLDVDDYLEGLIFQAGVDFE
jgi:hypothetical protein